MTARPPSGGPAGVTGDVPVLNIANALTVARLVLVPVVGYALLTDGGHSSGWRVVACAVFAIASITDRIDGDLARRRDIETDFGKLVDPIADKTLIGTALVCLSVLHLLAWWVTVVVLGRELVITLLRIWVIGRGVMPASRGGKIKTFTQAVAIGLYLLPLPHWLHPLAMVVMALALLLTITTGVDYVVRAVALRRRPMAEIRARRITEKTERIARHQARAARRRR